MMSTAVCRWLFLLISLSTWTTFTNSKEMRVVCYYTNWSVYRPGAAKFSPQNINPYLCTHLIYAFGGFTKENTLKPFDKYQDIEKGGYAKFTGLKTYNKNLKTMLAIGGWNEGSSRFSPMVANSERRKELVKNTIKFLRQNHFDGLDLDWEYPTFRDGGKPRDRDNYAQLVQELREEFDRESEKTGRPRLLLTMAVPAGIEYINKGYDVPKLMKYLDWMNILSYDYHSAFEPAVNHHAPLYSLEEDNEYNYDAELNIDYTVKHYMKMGADPHKLVLGIPTYGRSYTLYNPEAYEIGSPADGPGDMGEATRENGYLAYYEICEYVKSQGWEVEQPNPKAMGPYAFKDNQWVGYDDENIVRKKSEYVAENSLGGIMFWAIDNDDFRGTCHGKPYPLIEAAKEALLEAYGITDDNLISPPTKPKGRTRSRTKAATKVKSDDDEETKVEKVSNSGGSRRRNRLKSKAKEQDRESGSSRQKHRRKELRATTETPTTHSSLKVVTPSYTTPAPPSTPDLDGAFKCEDEGFFPHPKDCKKYFWCLSGAGDSGIVAHQFTCPAGLYFNKAADSCDYTQNVLCNKKFQKPTTTVTASPPISSTTTTTTTTPLFSTTRAPPKITAATSRTTFKITTTTEAFDDEYEYEDEEEDEDVDEKSGTDSEEDPRVIKELIELIKKAGGIEELEKQLSGTKTDTTVSTFGSTTPSAISKSLYERVLNKAVKNTLISKKNSLTTLRNSRGPQNDGIRQNDESSTNSKTERGKLQYTSISRQRPSTEKSVEGEEEIEEEVEEEEVKEDNTKTRRTFSKKFQPEYVTIRRPRVSTTTEAIEKDSSLNRNKILGEISDEEYEDDIEDEDADDDVEEDDEPTRKQNTPQYVNIRRQRPSTTEETSTSKYTVIRRGSTSTEGVPDTEEDTTSKYKTIRRGTTATPVTSTEQESSSSKFQLRRGTTLSTTPSSVSDGATSRFKNFRRGSTSSKPITTTPQSTTVLNENNPTTQLDEENDVTPRSSIRRGSTETSTIKTGYQVINRSSTTVQPEIITTIAANIESSLGSSTTEVAPAIPSSEEDKPTTLANIIEDIAATDLPSTTVKNSIVGNDISKDSEVQKSEDSSITAESVPTTTSPDVTDNETGTSQKNEPQLLNHQPSSVLSRGPSSTVKPITEPSVQSSKVSQSNFKFRLKPKTSDLFDKSSIQTSTSTTETSALKNQHRFRGRGGSRFNLNNQRTSENEETSGEDINSKVKLRKRVSTTEKYIEENRTFRPSEIADLSSLTAVDFERVKELNFGRNHRRRGRINVSTTSSTVAENPSEEIADESLKTSTKALPQESKLTETKSFGIGRRLVSKKIDQINSSSQINPAKRIRGFGSRTTRQPSSTESSVSKNTESSSPEVSSITPRSRRVVRRFRTTTSKPIPNKDTNENGKSDEITNFRRRPGSTQNLTQTNENSTKLNSNENPLRKLFNKKPTRLPFIIQKNDVEEDNDDSIDEDSSTEEGENIKLSESNIRENSDVNSYDIGGKPRRVFKLIRPKSEILHGKVSSEKETSSTKPHAVSETPEDHIKDEIAKKILENVTDHEVLKVKVESTENNNTDTSTETFAEETTTDNIKTTTKGYEEIKTSSQPNFRTRKIIRKIKPTVASVSADKVSTTESTTGRKRKIIRKLRPIAGIKKDIEISNSDVNNNTQSDQIINKDGLNTDNDNHTKTEVVTKQLFRPALTRSKNKYLKSNVESTIESNKEIKLPTRITPRKFPNRNQSRTISTSSNITNLFKTATENSTKPIFRPKLPATRRVPLRQYSRSTTTVKNEQNIESITESLKSDLEQKPLNKDFEKELETILPPLTNLESSTELNENQSTEDNKTSIKFEDTTAKNTQEDEVVKQLSEEEINSSDKSKDNETINTSTQNINILDNSVTTTKTIVDITEKEILSSTSDENLINLNEDTTEAISTTTEFLQVPSLDQENSSIKSSTTVRNYQTPLPSTTETIVDNNDEDDEEEDEESSDELGNTKRNYVSVFRSYTTTKSFNDFDSDNEDETPKFEDLFEDKDSNKELYEDKESPKELYEDEFKFDEPKEFGSYGEDQNDDEFYKFDDESFMGDTSTEFGDMFSYTPNDVLDEEKTEVQPIETSSIKNHFYRPNRPAFVRPKITFSTTEKPVTEGPKYKTYAKIQPKTLQTGPIQDESFNNTDSNDNPEKPANVVLFSNRLKYKTLERTTSLPTSINNTTDLNETNKPLEENSVAEGTTTHLHILSAEDTTITTQTIKTDLNLTQPTDTVFNDISSTVPYTNIDSDVTTFPSTDDLENELTTTSNQSPTVEIEMSTVTDNILQTETIPNTEVGTTETFIIPELSEQNSSDTGTDATESALTDFITETSAVTLEEKETSSESTTPTSPETTTPYKRRSTLKPINSRPKFTPIRRKNAYVAPSTTEQSKKSKFYRNRYQKATTESITPDVSQVSSDNIDRLSTPSSINKFLYRYSTRKPISFENKPEENEKEIDDDDETLSDILPVHSSAVPISEYIISSSTTETNIAGIEGNSDEENVKKDDKLIDADVDVEEEKDKIDDQAILSVHSGTVINISNSKITKPPRISNNPIDSRRPNSPVQSNNPLFSGRSTTPRVVNRPIFGKTTEIPKIADDLSGIDTEAVKNRNKNLFSKHRKINSPTSVTSVGSLEEKENPEESTETEHALDMTTNSQDYVTISPSTTESVTKASVAETTEILTTLHHVFAEVNDNDQGNNTETTTESLNSSVVSTTGKIERLIEVNRIVQVKTTEAKLKNHVRQEQPTAEVIQPVLDKIGEINRVTVIKVVDGNDTVLETINSRENEIKQTDPLSPVYIPEPTTTESSRGALPKLPIIELPAKVEEVSAPSILGNINLTDIKVTIDKISDLLQTRSREEKKLDVTSKSDSTNNGNQIKTDERKTEIIDGISHINIVTPRPIFSEAATIPLEGLFQTESTGTPKTVNSAPFDELLETEHSKFVSVRVLHPDENFAKGVRDNSKVLPIKLLKQDNEGATLRAKVVEVKPKSGFDSIKIVPIKVEMSKRISDNLPIVRVTSQNKNIEYT